MAKMFKFVWFVSLFAGLFALLWTYASIPQIVKVMEGMRVDKESFFYSCLAFLCICNFSLYVLSQNNFIGKFPYLQVWKYTFGIVLNGFFIVSVLFIIAFNDSQQYNFDNSGYLIIFFLCLMIVWLIALPFLIVLKRKPDNFLQK